MLELITSLFLLFLLVNVVYPLRRFGLTRWRAVGLVLVTAVVMGVIGQRSMTDEERAVAEQKRVAERGDRSGRNREGETPRV